MGRRGQNGAMQGVGDPARRSSKPGPLLIAEALFRSRYLHVRQVCHKRTKGSRSFHASPDATAANGFPHRGRCAWNSVVGADTSSSKVGP